MKYQLEFAALIQHEFPQLSAHEVAVAIQKLIRLGSRYRKLAIAYTGTMSEQEYTTRSRSVEEEMAEVVQEYFGPLCRLVFDGDPRGYGMIKLVVPSGRTNDFAQTGLVIPGS